MSSFPNTIVEDEEKHNPLHPPSPSTSDTPSHSDPKSKWKIAYHKLGNRFASWTFLETRGIERVEPHNRQSLHKLGFTQVGLVWFSMNLAANNITLGMLGPAVFELGFFDSAMCAFFGMLLGSLPVGHQATLGPRSGHRNLIVSRYTMGYYPVKIVVLFNIIICLGYSVLDLIIAGQMFSAVSPNGSLSIIVGIVVTAVLTFFISTFGYSLFHYYERYNWVPQVIVLCILAGVSGPGYDLSAESEGNSRTIIGNRLSFFSLCFSAAVTYAGMAANFFVYYPEETTKWKIFAVTNIGLILSFTFTFIVGIGLASAIHLNAAWANAYEVSQGALIVEAFHPLGGFGSFCSVVVALGLVANVIPPAYTAGLCFQMLGRVCAKIPRPVWNVVGILIFTICAIVGRAHLAVIFTNFLALMGYFVSIWLAISIEEEFIFRPRMRTPENDHGFDWAVWKDKSKLPYGFAAFVAFGIGWVGSVLCMAQVWYIGPIARLVGDFGTDMGNYVGFAWTALVFPPLRWLELKKFKR